VPGGELNLLGTMPKAMRDVGARVRDKERNRELAFQFGREYFDGPREQGYGGYRYDGRWVPVARRILERYRLGAGDRLLDVGCAKGFLMKDLLDLEPRLEVWGLDISRYAIDQCHADVAGRIVCGNCAALPFESRAFAAVIAINVVHNLPRAGCIEALREIERVGRAGRAFVQVDAYRSEDERELFEAWMLTARTYGRPEDWRALFDEAGYSGDYYWTVLERQEATGG